MFLQDKDGRASDGIFRLIAELMITNAHMQSDEIARGIFALKGQHIPAQSKVVFERRPG